MLPGQGGGLEVDRCSGRPCPAQSRVDTATVTLRNCSVQHQAAPSTARVGEGQGDTGSGGTMLIPRDDSHHRDEMPPDNITQQCPLSRCHVSRDGAKVAVSKVPNSGADVSQR